MADVYVNQFGKLNKSKKIFCVKVYLLHTQLQNELNLGTFSSANADIRDNCHHFDELIGMSCN